ncbi:MAG: hypothetical protein MRY21_02745 [Simkaniaceae bacterium]|nr:hypothetical protein [Simkaniaceae bacterium]
MALRAEFHPSGGDFSNPISAGIDWLGRKMAKPMLSGAKAVVQMLDPVRPGFRDQCRTSFKEKAMRVPKVAKIAVAATAGGVLAAAGRVLTSIAHCNKRDFTFVTPKNESLNPVPESLSVMTYNASGMDLLSRMSKMRPFAERLESWPEAIRDAGSPSVLCVNEMFDPTNAWKLVDKLKKLGYRYFILNANPHPIKLNSGLMMASKFPLENPVTHTFCYRSKEDRLSSKGVIGATVRVGEERIGVFASHFNTRTTKTTPSGENIITDQARTFTHLMDRYATEHGLGDRIVGCVDANIENWPADPTFRSIPKEGEGGTYFSWFDPPHEDVGQLWDLKQFESWALAGNSPDHIIAKNTLPLRGTISRMRGLSDHLAVKTEIPLRA